MQLGRLNAKGQVVELRWYQTYDKHGVNSEETLQYREDDESEWEDVEFVREKESTEDNA